MTDEKEASKRGTETVETERSLPSGRLVSWAGRMARLFFQTMNILFVGEETTLPKDVLPEIDEELWYLWEDERDDFKRVELGLGKRPLFRPDFLQLLATLRRWFYGPED